MPTPFSLIQTTKTTQALACLQSFIVAFILTARKTLSFRVQERIAVRLYFS
ncbi:hypothetical protein E5E41_01170 [Helicobacter pylori]|nr:hypothetical protein E5E41_01170 [Helicobacter pylori]